MSCTPLLIDKRQLNHHACSSRLLLIVVVGGIAVCAGDRIALPTMEGYVQRYIWGDGGEVIMANHKALPVTPSILPGPACHRYWILLSFVMLLIRRDKAHISATSKAGLVNQ